MLFKILLPHHALHSILSIEDQGCSTVGIENGRRRSQLLELTSCFLATRAIAGAGQNRWADCLELHLTALAHRGEVFVLFLVHCTFPSHSCVPEDLLSVVQNVRSGPRLPLRSRRGHGVPTICRNAQVGRGRDGDCSPPPAQIRTCGFPAYGSYLG